MTVAWQRHPSSHPELRARDFVEFVKRLAAGHPSPSIGYRLLDKDDLISCEMLEPVAR
jgi:hypothetical protein